MACYVKQNLVIKSINFKKIHSVISASANVKSKTKSGESDEILHSYTVDI